MFLPKKHWTYAKDQEDKKILTALEQAEVLFFVQNKAYDDKMIIDYADKKKGIILSNDRYRDVLMTNPEFEDQIKNRFLAFLNHTHEAVLKGSHKLVNVVHMIKINFCLSDNMCLQNPPVHLGIRHSDDRGRPVRKIWPKPLSTSSLLRTTFAPSEGQISEDNT